MTYTQAIIRHDAVERYESARFFNPGEPVTVFVVGRVRFRADKRTQVTVKELVAAGYEMVHRFDCGGK